MKKNFNRPAWALALMALCLNVAEIAAADSAGIITNTPNLLGY